MVHSCVPHCNVIIANVVRLHRNIHDRHGIVPPPKINARQHLRPAVNVVAASNEIFSFRC